MSMNPISTPLAIGVYGHNISEVATRWDTAVTFGSDSLNFSGRTVTIEILVVHHPSMKFA